MTSISDLPVCILIQIFSHIKTIRQTADLRLVCQQWNQLILRYWSRREKYTMTQYITSPESFLEYASAIAKRHPRIKELSVEPVNKFANPATIEDVPSHYDVIGKLFLSLEKLNFIDTLMEDEVLNAIVKNCPKLRSLSLQSCHEISDTGLSLAIKNAPHIKELELICCPEVDSDLAPACRHLSALSFENCPFDADSWTKLSEAGGKENLEKIAACPMKYDTLCLISQKFPHLKDIYINEFDDEDQFISENYHGFPSLETLRITFGSVSDKSKLLQITSKCGKIRTLWVWNCINSATPTFIAEVLEQHVNSVEHLILDDNPAGQLEKIDLRNFSKLKKITIIGTTLTNQLIQRIIDASPCLRFLDISDCVPPSKLDIKATHNDFWLNTRPLPQRPSNIGIDPPYRAGYRTNYEAYEGPILELSCGDKPKYYYKVHDK
ncbi:uncharacterized protein LOC107361723 [Tetranychus urticae]|uniref:F-box domain-containing protein n=1 Tax=Tetranychus urticae TaxID=32264 RepID=T1K898_TETUR|nr:uncharacterized protein LOC107361723 [Tetranychus urticae]